MHYSRTRSLKRDGRDHSPSMKQSACESAFAEKGCTLHGLKGTWHRAAIKVKSRGNHLKVLEPFSGIQLSLLLCLDAPYIMHATVYYTTTYFFLEIKMQLLCNYGQPIRNVKTAFDEYVRRKFCGTCIVIQYKYWERNPGPWALVDFVWSKAKKIEQLRCAAVERESERKAQWQTDRQIDK